jgi:hypothetical protein
VADRGADLEYAVQGATVSDTGLADEVLEAWGQVAQAAPDPPRRLVDGAVDAYLRSCAHRSREEDSSRFLAILTPAGRIYLS